MRAASTRRSILVNTDQTESTRDVSSVSYSATNATLRWPGQDGVFSPTLPLLAISNSGPAGILYRDPGDYAYINTTNNYVYVPKNPHTIQIQYTPTGSGDITISVSQATISD